MLNLDKIKIAIVGMGNCASSLIQGIHYYDGKNPEDAIGLMHWEIGGYKPSDIDVVVILDELSVADIETYNAMLDTLPHRELICGFLSGQKEIMAWEPSDLFQFIHCLTSFDICWLLCYHHPERR